jgi:lipopolysaccharide/colanic/teichoic acid biosynthesis glycosyltransferase
MGKRLLDLLASGAGLVAFAPVFLIIALLIKLDSPGPVFFRQERVGRHGRVFRIYKFRTMTVAPRAPDMQLTVSGDARITRVGAVLRQYKLDELAQLVDVFRGTMSLVGPRPEVPKYVAMYPVEQRLRILSVRPGITDFASLKFRHENELLAKALDPEREYVDVILPEKLRVAEQYVDTASVSTDLKVLGMTLRAVFVPELPAGKVRNMMNTPRFWRKVDDFMSRTDGGRRAMSLAVDGLVVLIAWHATYLFRLGFERWQPGRPWYDDYVSLVIVALYLVTLSVFGLHRALWRFFAFDDLRRLLITCTVAGLIGAVSILMAQLVGVARAVLVLHPWFSFIGLVMIRLLYRMLWEHAHARSMGDDGERRYVIVLGAGPVARRLLAGLHQRHGWNVLALLDDDPSLHGARIAGVPVVGPLSRLQDKALLASATHVIVALDNTTVGQREAAIQQAAEAGLVVLSVPTGDDLTVVRAPDAAETTPNGAAAT